MLSGMSSSLSCFVHRNRFLNQWGLRSADPTDIVLLFSHVSDARMSDLPTVTQCDNVEIKYICVGFLMLEPQLQSRSEA